jgi:hypothetical protein
LFVLAYSPTTQIRLSLKFFFIGQIFTLQNN